MHAARGEAPIADARDGVRQLREAAVAKIATIAAREMLAVIPAAFTGADAALMPKPTCGGGKRLSCS
ncbi:hypothetical protein HDC36_003696 [Xanthomonas sp. JAI131]|uniref:hypothetical protein n=1 Tax=Xanthomonas sp. JAI131 TaxID=2723067 RepID=UPI0015C8B1A5|nr:hypothetical protein [Xanthomonas sp. JAI131]NYF22220.1 hypothetical protein [Xanthomonas sp. JAI131]